MDWFGPTDFTKMGGSQDEPTPRKRGLSAAQSRTRRELPERTPLPTSQGLRAFLIMHGEEDKVVPISQSELLDEALRKAGVESTLVRVPGSGHGGPGFNSPENRKKIEDFFEKHLK